MPLVCILMFFLVTLFYLALLPIEGNLRWATALTWSGQVEYARAPWRKFEVDGIEAGLVTGFKNLKFLKV